MGEYKPGLWTMDWSMDWTKKIALLVPPAGFAARPHFREQNTAVSEEVKDHMHVTQLLL